MDTVVHVGSREPSEPVAAALSDAGFALRAAADLAAALDTLAREPVACLLLGGDDPAGDAARLRRRGHDTPALAVLADGDPLPDDTHLAGVVPADDPERVARRVSDAVADRRVRETRRERGRLRSVLADARTALPDDPDVEALTDLARRLTDADGYTGAWVGRHEASTDVVVPVAARGVAADHIRTLTGTDDAEPVVRALADGVATAVDGDTATLAARVGSGPFVLVCYGRREHGVTDEECEAFARFAEGSEPDPEDAAQAPENDAVATDGAPATDDGIRVLGETIAHELANHLDVASTHLDLADGDENVDRASAALDRIADVAAEARRLASADLDTEAVSVGDAARDAWDRVVSGDATLVVAQDGRVEGDPQLLRLLLENLLRNAVEHGADGDTDVTVTVAVTAEGFRVDDDGAGIPPEDRDRVLEWGYSTGGTGAGLGIVSLVAERHGWDVSVGESESGGARFAFV
ncbi:sensor histidine kinase [Halosegnis marinus]|uniref:histidine kinase n=1 Tax=Halosegnis marinus TaxID=3034023 RepID=A0ABD5ZT97_9EURY|nr:HAMP domain-containing sensor histidine kinase [Halosegnis sp. DT85]